MKTPEDADPSRKASRPENTPGVFLEHFDMTWPTGGKESIVYSDVMLVARQAAEQAGWGFHSYSTADSGATREDFIRRNIRDFPTLILYFDGVELGRLTWVAHTVKGILTWAKELLKDQNIETFEEWVEKIIHPKPPPPVVLKNEADLEAMLLRKELERHLAEVTAMEVIYFGGSLPGMRRKITPHSYKGTRDQNRIIAFCHQTEEEKTFRLDRMHLPCPPLNGGLNDYRVITSILAKTELLDGMLRQVMRQSEKPMARALAAHFDEKGEFESFFDEYPYGGFILECKMTSSSIDLALGYEANDCEMEHYEFTAESEPKLCG